MPRVAISQAVSHVPLVIDCFSGTRVLARAPTCLLSNKETPSVLRTINNLIEHGYISINSTSGGRLFLIIGNIAKDCSR